MGLLFYVQLKTHQISEAYILTFQTYAGDTNQFIFNFTCFAKIKIVASNDLLIFSMMYQIAHGYSQVVCK